MWLVDSNRHSQLPHTLPLFPRSHSHRLRPQAALSLPGILLGIPQLALGWEVFFNPPGIPAQHHYLVHPDAFIDHHPAENAAVAVAYVPGHGDGLPRDQRGQLITRCFPVRLVATLLRCVDFGPGRRIPNCEISRQLS